MKKNEFIKNLVVALEGNVTKSEIASQMAYYNDYVDSEIRKGRTEEEIIESLGDPRLIAKTIIDTSQDTAGNYVYESEEPASSSTKSFKINSWYTKLIMALIVLAVIIIVVVIGGLIGFVLLKFAIPIIIIILFLSMFRKR